jgi:hypothetical protein
MTVQSGDSERIACLGKNTAGDAYYNLTGAITDIEHTKGNCDAVSMRTLKRVAAQLAKAMMD